MSYIITVWPIVTAGHPSARQGDACVGCILWTGLCSQEHGDLTHGSG